MRYNLVFVLICGAFWSACGGVLSADSAGLHADRPKEIRLTDTLFTAHPECRATCFVFPVGPPSAKKYYNAQGFGQNAHLGDDWNGTGMGNTDLGDPVYPVANGYVIRAEHQGPGWGNVVQVIHVWKEGDMERWVESLYAHLDSMWVKEGDYLLQNQQLGTIGTADGLYAAHLHLEIRDSLWMPVGGGYSNETAGYTDPTTFIQSHFCRE